MIPRAYKEVARYIIILLIMSFTYEFSVYAYELEKAGKLTMQFAGVVASSYGALTLVLKYIFQTKVNDA